MYFMYGFICGVVCGGISTFTATTYCKYAYSQEMHKLECDLIWNLLKIYTSLSKPIKKCYNCFRIKYNCAQNFKLYLNGNIIQKYILSKEILNNNIFPEYDLVICNIHTDTKEKYDATRLATREAKYDVICDNRLKNIKNYFLNNDSVKRSSVKIYNPVIYIHSTNKRYEFNFDKYNYSLVENKLFNGAFVKYWLKEYYNENVENLGSYNIIFMDKNMTEINLNENCSIIINENDFSVVKS